MLTNPIILVIKNNIPAFYHNFILFETDYYNKPILNNEITVLGFSYKGVEKYSYEDVINSFCTSNYFISDIYLKSISGSRDGAFQTLKYHNKSFRKDDIIQDYLPSLKINENCGKFIFNRFLNKGSAFILDIPAFATLEIAFVVKSK